MAKSLSRTLNESFQLFEKTSEVRKYKQYEQNPPAWYDKTMGKDLTSKDYNVYDKLAKMLSVYVGATNFPGYGSKTFPDEFKKYIETLRKSYMNEYIDINYVPSSILAGMIDEVFTSQSLITKLFKSNVVRQPWMLPLSTYHNISVSAQVHKKPTYNKEIPTYFDGVTLIVNFKSLNKKSTLYIDFGTEFTTPTSKEITNALAAEIPKYFGKYAAPLIISEIGTIPNVDYTIIEQ